jgi:hypothetical protein
MPFGYQETMIENKGMDNMWAELKWDYLHHYTSLLSRLYLEYHV